MKQNDFSGLILLAVLFGLSKTAFLRAESTEDFREHAFTICKDNLSGQLVKGSQSIGDSAVHVNIMPSCPDGCAPMGLWHSHPVGVPQASDADIFEMKRLGLQHLCISSGGITRCQEVR